MWKDEATEDLRKRLRKVWTHTGNKLVWEVKDKREGFFMR